ncbi:MAG: TetR/AcrR family transcriptional regulator [Dehalococcoidales bacterium]|nr:TetR/AcrR family transcriptional regulator [Dehalococcoidales bacterium]
MAREEKKERITRQREEQILDAALEVFSEKGFGAATIPDIAGKAGLAVGSIYNYFPNKRELFVAVIKNFILNAPMMNLIDEMPNGNLPETFIKILYNRLSLLEAEDISHIPFLMSEVQRDPELKELWYREMLEPFITKMENVYRKLSYSGDQDNISTVMTVRMVGGFILGFLMFKIMEGEHSPVNTLPREKVAEYMRGFLLHGIGINATAQQPGGHVNE